MTTLLGTVGFTADRYIGNGNGNAKKPRVEPEKRYDNTIIALAIALSFIVGYGAFSVTSFEPREVSPEPGILTFNVTKTATICNKWGSVYPTSNLTFLDGGIDCQRQNTTSPEFFYLRAQMFAFAYTNMTPPTVFVDAQLTIPLNWFTSWGITGPWGKDTGHWENRNFTVSLYEVKESWPIRYIGGGQYLEYVSWAMFSEPSYADRNPVDVVSGINKTNNGYGDTTHGAIVFNITRAINDWKAGLWNPANGFLVAMIAPWETTDREWFNATGLQFLGVGLKFPMSGVKMQIGLTQVIPEFTDILVPVTFLVVLMVLVRSRLSRCGEEAVTSGSGLTDGTGGCPRKRTARPRCVGKSNSMSRTER